MKTINREFDLGDKVITTLKLKAVANRESTIEKAVTTVEGVRESLAGDRVTVVRQYDLQGGYSKVDEKHVFPAKDAKKMVMKILADRMQAVAEMEVPE